MRIKAETARKNPPPAQTSPSFSSVDVSSSSSSAPLPRASTSPTRPLHTSCHPTSDCLRKTLEREAKSIAVKQLSQELKRLKLEQSQLELEVLRHKNREKFFRTHFPNPRDENPHALDFRSNIAAESAKISKNIDNLQQRLQEVRQSHRVEASSLFPLHPPPHPDLTSGHCHTPTRYPTSALPNIPNVSEGARRVGGEASSSRNTIVDLDDIVNIWDKAGSSSAAQTARLGALSLQDPASPQSTSSVDSQAILDVETLDVDEEVAEDLVEKAVENIVENIVEGVGERSAAEAEGGAEAEAEEEQRSPSNLRPSNLRASISLSGSAPSSVSRR